MGLVQKSLDQSRGSGNLAYSRASQMLKAGGGISMGDVFGKPTNVSGLQDFLRQGANQNQYQLYRGWVYSAVSAIANVASGQPVHMARLKGAVNTQRTPHSSKNYRKELQIAKARQHERHMALKTMPKGLSAKAARQELEMIFDHAVLDAIDKPNPIQYRWQLTNMFVSNLCLTGWGFLVGGENDEGKFEFYCIPTTWVKPIHTKGLFQQFKIIDPKNPAAESDAEPLDADQVAFAYIPDPSDPLRACAPTASQFRAIQIDDHIQKSQQAFFENGIFPSVVVKVGSNPHPDVTTAPGVRPRLTSKQRRQIQTAIKKVMGGVANYGNPAIVDGLIEGIERISATQTEMGWDKSEKAIRARILSGLGVHPFILGEEMAGSYAQAYVIQDRFCERVNIYLEMLSSVVTHFLGRSENDKTLIWWEACKAVDPQLEQSMWLKSRENMDVSQNELRAHMGLPPDMDTNERVINHSSIQWITNISMNVANGKMTREQAVGIYEGMGLPTPLAEEIAGSGTLPSAVVLENPPPKITDEKPDEEEPKEEEQELDDE